MTLMPILAEAKPPRKRKSRFRTFTSPSKRSPGGVGCFVCYDLKYTAVMIRAYRGIVPRIAASAYIDQSAQVIGDVVVGERSSIWPNVTARGDVNEIRIGNE